LPADPVATGPGDGIPFHKSGDRIAAVARQTNESDRAVLELGIGPNQAWGRNRASRSPLSPDFHDQDAGGFVIEQGRRAVQPPLCFNAGQFRSRSKGRGNRPQAGHLHLPNFIRYPPDNSPQSGKANERPNKPTRYFRLCQ
jgi:hypothetical protein